MRRLIPLLFFISGFLVARAQAQETYSIPAAAPDVTTLTDIVTFANVDTCQRLGQVPTCTQAQACTAANAPGGAACTAAQARGAKARIWPATQAGREEFVIQQIVLPRFGDLTQALPDLKRHVQAWAANLATTVNKNLSCGNLALPNGCYP